MALAILDESHLAQTAAAIREKNGKGALYKPSDFAAAISALGDAKLGEDSGGGTSLKVSGLGFRPGFAMVCARSMNPYTGCYIYLDSDGEYLRYVMDGYYPVQSGSSSAVAALFTMTEDGFEVDTGSVQLPASLSYAARV